MANYLRPGVFVEETLNPLTDPSQNSTDSVAAFVGTSAKGGPLGPTLVTSWSQYQSLFGSIRGATDELPYAVYSFFNNGGSQCYVVRAVNADAVAAAVTINDADSDGAGADTAEPALTVTAKAAGAWASSPTSTSRIFVTVQAGAVTGHFDLIIEVGSGTSLLAREQFLDLTLDPSDTRYALPIVNSPTVGSSYISIADPGTWGVDATAGLHGNPAPVSQTPLTGGSDGTGTPDLYAAAQRLDNVDGLLDVNLPGVSDTAVLTNVINWAATKGDRFVVVDAPKPGVNDDNAAMTTALTTFVGSLPVSAYGAVYGPWVYMVDPSSTVQGALRLTAPGGAVLGQYARTDVVRGVQKAPAGTSTGLRVIQVAARFTDTQLDTLNQANVNIIKSIPGAGFCIFGARTLAKATPDRYINIRRALNSLKRGVSAVTRFAVFEQNDENLWDTLRAVTEQYLTTQFQTGLLRGDIPEQAFYVKCDSTNNPPSSIATGTVVVEVGVALSSPAEFVVIRIGQFDGGSTVTEIAA